MDNKEIFESRLDLSGLNQAVNNIRQEIGKVIVGQQNSIDLILTALLADGHVLIEGVPGVAKTLTAKLLAKTIKADFSRIQFTPDLMPSDILGTSVFNFKNSEFDFKKGPIFSNIVLIDEINRAPAKTQAALFEVMEERQISIEGNYFKMDYPFIILATQNPIEHEGTYRLPEAQLDRFIFKIEIDYPSLEDEVEILNRFHKNENKINIDNIDAVLNAEDLKKYRQLTGQVKIESHLVEYIAQIVNKTRNSADLYIGASPRASLAILATSKAYAAINGRDFVTPEDIIKVALPVLKHRIILTPEKEMEGSTATEIINILIQTIEVPR